MIAIRASIRRFGRIWFIIQADEEQDQYREKENRESNEERARGLAPSTHGEIHDSNDGSDDGKAEHGFIPNPNHAFFTK